MIHTVKSLKALLREYKHLHNFAYSKMKKDELMAIAIKLGLIKSDNQVIKPKIVKPKIVKPKIVKQTVKQNVVVEKKVNNDDDDYDKVSAKLQQLIFITPNDKLKQALIKQNFVCGQKQIKISFLG